MKVEKQVFIPIFKRRNLVVEIDRVFLDIIEAHDSNRLIDSNSKRILSCDLKKITFGQEFYVVVRP